MALNVVNVISIIRSMRTRAERPSYIHTWILEVVCVYKTLVAHTATRAINNVWIIVVIRIFMRRCRYEKCVLYTQHLSL